MYKLIKIIFFIVFLSSMKLWITWVLPFHLIEIVGFFILSFCYLYLGKTIPFTFKTLFVFFSLLILCVYNTFFNHNILIFNIAGQIILYSYAFFIFLLPTKRQIDLLNTITKWFAYLMIPSIFLYLVLSVVDIPSLGSIRPSDDTYGEYLNYIFYVKRNYHLDRFIRFNGPFIEPGHLGMISAFVLYATKYDFTKASTWIIFISIILSFSLAGYLLLFLGYILINIQNVKRIILLFIILSATAYIIQFQENNILSEIVIDKLNSSMENTDIRFLGDTNYYFAKYLKQNSLWFGVNDNFMGAGYKIYILHYGIIGVILVSIFYFSIACFALDKKYAFCFFLLMSLAFLQRTYPMWCAWFLPFITGISSNDIVKKIKNPRRRSAGYLRFLFEIQSNNVS